MQSRSRNSEFLLQAEVRTTNDAFEQHVHVHVICEYMCAN